MAGPRLTAQARLFSSFWIVALLLSAAIALYFYSTRSATEMKKPVEQPRPQPRQLADAPKTSVQRHEQPSQVTLDFQPPWFKKSHTSKPTDDHAPLGFKAKSLRFFESGSHMMPRGQRIYQSRFSKAMTRFVNWEVELDHPPRNYPINLPLTAVYYRSDGSVFWRQTGNFRIEPNWTTSWHAWSRGYNDAGKWPSGTYLVEITIEGELVAKRNFIIE